MNATELKSEIARFADGRTIIIGEGLSDDRYERFIETVVEMGGVDMFWSEDEYVMLVRTLNGTPVAAIYEDAGYINGNIVND